MNRFCVVLLVFTLVGAHVAYAAAQQDDRANTDPTPPVAAAAADTLAELDAFRRDLFGAFNRGEYKTMLEQYCHPDVIVTWQDGVSGQGYDAVLAEFDKLSKFIDKMAVQPNTDMRLIYADGRMVVASGDMEDEYALARGVDVALKSRWTATLVKEDDKWLLLSFSASTNAFDNEVISLYLRRAIYLSAAIAAIAGLIVGIAGTLVVARRKKPT